MRDPGAVSPAPEPLASEPVRVRQFLLFFKSYMALAAVAAACLPVPVASMKLIPTYAVHAAPLGLYTALFCFLLLAYVFYMRHYLARWMFRDTGVLRRTMAVLPALLIASAMTTAVAYHRLLEASLDVYRRRGLDQAAGEILKLGDWADIPYSHWLMATYLLLFLLAEAAFVLMAIREYLQDVLEIDDRRLLRRSR